jgi:monofunctional biosynthetic peptidoglycan transglycosylase
MALQNDQTGKISGELFLQDGFGFASYRVTPTEKPSWNIQGSNEVAIEAKGDGRSYRILLKDARAYSASEDYSWQFEFTPRASFEQVRIPLDRLRPIFRGRELEDLPPIDLAEILEIGIQINDGIEGPYSIELKSIEAI